MYVVYIIIYNFKFTILISRGQALFCIVDWSESYQSGTNYRTLTEINETVTNSSSPQILAFHFIIEMKYNEENEFVHLEN